MFHKSIKTLPMCLAFALFALSTLSVRAEDADQKADDTPPILKHDDPTWQMNFKPAETIAVQDGGRKKPLQSYAFEAIEQMCGRPLIGATFIKVPLKPEGQDEKAQELVKFSSMDLFMNIWCHPEYWEDKPIILVPNSELRTLIDPKNPTGKTDKYLSINTLKKSEALKNLFESAKMKKPADMTTLEEEAQLVFKRMMIFARIVGSDSALSIVPHFKKSEGEWADMALLKTAMSNARADEVVFGKEKAGRAVAAFDAFKAAYKARVSGRFEQASAELRDALADLSPKVYPAALTMEREVKYNQLRPFAWAWMLYLLAAILAVFALKFRGKGIYAAAYAVYISGFAIHIYGFYLRCMIAGRPPVTNMYESVIWVGSGAIFFGLIFELIYRKRLFLISGAVAGFLCLVMMDLIPVLVNNSQAPGVDSTINPLEPVLRSAYWLTVHVLTITLSYAAFMLAWALGHITLYAHLARPHSRIEHSELHQLVYRVIQVGVLLLAIGTMLGGVWAYYSWGRFWGWDPKETWAFIALMCYLVVLHGRFAGFWGNFGNAFGSVFCFLSVVMAWYGVNFVLGVGKHSYGSGAGGMTYVAIAVVLDLLFLAAATTSYVLSKKKMSPEETAEVERPEPRGALPSEEKPDSRGSLSAGE